MTTTHRSAGSPPDVRDRWRASSVASVWLRPADWYHPAVDALIEAVLAGEDGGPAAERLGEARAEAGVGISETIDDLACLFDAAELAGPPLGLVRSLCEGWAAGQAAGPVLTHCIDPDSGLPTAEYLGVRLTETYGTAERTGRRAGDTHALLVTDVEASPLAPWSRIVRSAVVGQGLVLTFGEGHPMAALGGGVFAVLVERGSDLGATAMHLRTALTDHARSMGAQDLVREPPRVWLEPLPDTRMQAVELLEHLHR
ncbi:hypothetical protein [Cellulomonas aerilata]|uniref:GGDEF domain-containing protein n=1 Tax=Cellulomonas aerilata TaxID=515326 RepID=A0A512D822_9CELL|nr:hypothetical protein [Cellulomonas aerilata]GEO32634.1 hypothetical protein CAE01nite_03590 [Cellulomonas aerilata]